MTTEDNAKMVEGRKKLVEAAHLLGAAKLVLDSFQGCGHGCSFTNDREEWQKKYNARLDFFLYCLDEYVVGQ